MAEPTPLVGPADPGPPALLSGEAPAALSRTLRRFPISEHGWRENDRERWRRSPMCIQRWIRHEIAAARVESDPRSAGFQKSARAPISKRRRAQRMGFSNYLPWCRSSERGEVTGERYNSCAAGRPRQLELE